MDYLSSKSQIWEHRMGSVMEYSDYGWYISALVNAIEKGHKLEILDDKDGSVENFKVRNFTINNIKSKYGPEAISFELESFDSGVVSVFSLTDISKVEENSASNPHRFLKYYLYSSSGNYRFTFLIS